MEHIIKCKVIGCRETSGARGLCKKHYKRWQRHGNTDHNSRPKLPGYEKNKNHPLYNKWRTVTRMDLGKAVCERWKSLFNFIEDLEAPPSEKHQLRRKDTSLPFSPENYYWAAPLGNYEERKKELKERMKITKALDPSWTKRTHLKKHYNLTLEQYQEMSENQGHVCKICGNPESRKNCSLSVDHCHDSGKIRSLLCSNCNSALGLFKDSQEILLSAINYLKLHSQA